MFNSKRFHGCAALLARSWLAAGIAIVLPGAGGADTSYTYAGASLTQGVAQDTDYAASGVVLKPRTGTPPYLYVSDQNSGRVLKFDTTGGAPALVGQLPSCVGCSTNASTWKPSAIAVDMDGTPWVVNVGSGAPKVVTRLGAVPQSIQMPNNDASGMAIDEQGTIWVAGVNQAMSIDPASLTSSGVSGLGGSTPGSLSYRGGWIYAAGGDRVFRFNGSGKDNKDFACTGARGVAAVGAGKVFITTSRGLYAASFPAPQQGQASCTAVAGGGLSLDGIAVDGSGKIWMAAPGSISPSQPQAVYWYDPASGVFSSAISISGIGEPHGAAIAADGTPWVVGRNGLAHVVNGSAVTYPQAGVYLDTNSDMTGWQLRGVVQKGTWTITQDGGFAGAIWGKVAWSATTPAGTSIVALARAADSVNALAAAPAVPVSNGVAFNSGAVAGRFLQVQFTLKGSEQVSPVLEQVTLTPSGGALGATCATNTDCGSGFCADGVCCNSACAGQCEACAEPGSLGTCTAVAGGPRNGRPACASDGSSCGGACDGTQRATCSYPSTSVACRDASCAAGNETLAATCDGAGSCPLATSSCNRYVCGASACLKACQTDAECSIRNLCESTACVADTVGPTVTIAPVLPLTNKASLALAGTVTDRGGVASALLKVNGTVAVPALTLDAEGNWSATVTLTEGLNELAVEATDLAGNSGGNGVSITLDTTPPTLAITSPAAGKAFPTSTIAFELEVADASQVTVSAGGLLFSPDAGGHVTGSIQAQGDLGSNTLTFVAMDAAGNTTTKTVEVFLDLFAPVVTSDLDPPSMRQVGPLAAPNDTLAFTVRVEEAGAFDYGYTGGTTQHVDRLQGATLYLSLSLAEGPNEFSFSATDEVRRTTMKTWSVLYDKTPPTGAFASPPAYLRSGADLTVRANDNLTGVSAIAFRLDDDPTVASGLVSHDQDAADPYSATYHLDITGLGDGEHVIHADLTDGVGNTAAIEHRFAVDKTPPTVTLALAPTADGNVVTNGGVEQVRGTIAVTATASDATSGIAEVRLAVGGKDIGACASSPCTVDFDTRALGVDGPFTIAATATDRAGNAGDAQRTPTSDNTAPKNFIASPTSGAVLTGDTMTITGVFEDAARIDCSIPGDGPWILTAAQPSVTVDLLGQLDGELVVTCTATDHVGNTSAPTAIATNVRHWIEVLDPVTLNLKTGGNSVVTYYVEGANIAILLPIAARQLNLVVAGASPIPALAHPASASVGDYNRNGVPDLTLKFDRQSLITALKSGIAAKLVDPSKPVTVRLYAGAHDLGQTTIRVNP